MSWRLTTVQLPNGSSQLFVVGSFGLPYGSRYAGPLQMILTSVATPNPGGGYSWSDLAEFDPSPIDFAAGDEYIFSLAGGSFAGTGAQLWAHGMSVSGALPNLRINYDLLSSWFDPANAVWADWKSYNQVAGGGPAGGVFGNPVVGQLEGGQQLQIWATASDLSWVDRQLGGSR